MWRKQLLGTAESHNPQEDPKSALTLLVIAMAAAWWSLMQQAGVALLWT
jgi:hypothetical protein